LLCDLPRRSTPNLPHTCRTPSLAPICTSREMVGRRVVLCVKRTRYFRLHHSLKPKKKNTIVIFLLHYSAEIASLCKVQTLSSYHEKVRVGRCYSSRRNCLWHFRGTSEASIFHAAPHLPLIRVFMEFRSHRVRGLQPLASRGRVSKNGLISGSGCRGVSARKSL